MELYDHQHGVGAKGLRDVDELFPPKTIPEGDRR